LLYRIKCKLAHMAGLQNDSEPVLCSKCNMAFPSDSEYLQHYDQEHRRAEENNNNNTN
jgi:hypothetical protein